MDATRARAPEIADLATAQALITALHEQLATSQRDVVSLRHQLDVLCRRLFGKKSERVDPRQLQLALAQLANEPGPVTEPVEMDLGETVTSKLEYEPASFVVLETARATYACPHCHTGVVEAAAPPQALETSLAGAGLLAHVIVAKYVDHLPLHRLDGICAREGIDLSRSTLCDWVADVATALAPVGAQLRREVVAADYLQTDDTSVTVLGDQGGSFKGRLWVYLDPLGQQVVFDATATHERDGPAAWLADFRGQLQADAYAGDDGLYTTGRVVEIGCMAHARRRFVEAFAMDGSAALMVALIQQLYQVERAAADLAPDARAGASSRSRCWPSSRLSATDWRRRPCRNPRSVTPCGV